MGRRGSSVLSGEKRWSRALSFRTSKILKELKQQRAIGSTRKSLDSGDTLVTPSTASSSSSSSSAHKSLSGPPAPKPQYENKAIQADLPPPPPPAPKPSFRNRDTFTGSGPSRPRALDALPNPEHYGGAYPSIDFDRSLDLGHWTAESGKRPEVESGTPLTTFHPFTRLPTELRLKIWRMHLERPRIVRISTIDFVKKLHFSPNSLGNLASNIQWYTNNRLPVLTRVCQESRAETLAFYRVHLSHEQRTFHFSPVYLNPEWDILLLNCTHDAFPMDVFLSDVLAYDPKGMGTVHLGSYLDPGKWDCSPLPGCAALEESTRHLKSYTQCAHAGMTVMTDVFPILRIGEGYILESVSMPRDKFTSYMPRISRNLHEERWSGRRAQLEKLLSRDVMADLSMQTLYSRMYQQRLDPPARSLSTDEWAAGLVIWNNDDRKGQGGRFMYFSCN